MALSREQTLRMWADYLPHRFTLKESAGFRAGEVFVSGIVCRACGKLFEHWVADALKHIDLKHGADWAHEYRPVAERLQGEQKARLQRAGLLPPKQPNPMPKIPGLRVAILHGDKGDTAHLYSAATAPQVEKQLWRKMEQGYAVTWPGGRRQWIRVCPLIKTGPVARESDRYLWDRSFNKVKAEIVLYTRTRDGQTTREAIRTQFVDFPE